MDKLLSLFTTLNRAKAAAAASGATDTGAVGASSDASSNNITYIIQSLHEELDGPNGVIQLLLPRILFLREVGVVDNDKNDVGDDGGSILYGDNALSLLSYLVESHPDEYMALTASSVRRIIDQTFTITSTTDTKSGDSATLPNKQNAAEVVSDALLLSLSKLLIGTNSDNQVGIATDVHATILVLCRWDAMQKNDHNGKISKRVLHILNMLWQHLHQQDRVQQRLYSTSQIRIAALMIDICLLGEEEMSMALSESNSDSGDDDDCIMDKLLYIALDHPNDDPLLQVSALDQLERLTTHEGITPVRSEFLLGNEVLRRGLLCLVGSPGSLSKDADVDEEWDDADPINGGAAFRLLTEICRVGILSSVSIVSDRTRAEFQVLLSNFQRALHNFHPQGELERLSYIHAVSSLIGSCAMVASSTSSSAGANSVMNAIVNDTTLLHEWLSLHSRVSQPKLKSTVLCSLSQVIEPSIWQENSQSNNVTRPSDSIVLQLYQAFSHANHERDATELLLASAKSPFVEERLGAYDMLRAMVMRGVGVRLLLLYDDGTGNNGSRGGSFLEWLLDQDLESTIEGKKAKYEIVHAMLSCNSDIIGGLLPPRALRQLEAWDRSGPSFMVTVPWDMATE
ncbi:hypothetical protein ACHAWU_001671 [Discostella pseudostelligera]|uniref:Uncharacterized protein n=1 Tax=Discostella pseudostelligera TaxID=259834 RepID=A0ABD3MLA3_9STRA